MRGRGIRKYVILVILSFLFLFPFSCHPVYASEANEEDADIKELTDFISGLTSKDVLGQLTEDRTELKVEKSVKEPEKTLKEGLKDFLIEFLRDSKESFMQFLKRNGFLLIFMAIVSLAIFIRKIISEREERKKLMNAVILDKEKR